MNKTKDDDRIEELIIKSGGELFNLNPFERHDLLLLLFLKKLEEFKIRDPEKVTSKNIEEHFKTTLEVTKKNYKTYLQSAIEQMENGDASLGYEIFAEILFYFISKPKSSSEITFTIHESSISSLNKRITQLLLFSDKIFCSYHWPVIPTISEDGSPGLDLIDNPGNLGMFPTRCGGREYLSVLEMEPFIEWLKGVKNALLDESIIFMPSGVQLVADTNLKNSNKSEPRRLSMEEYTNSVQTTVLDHYSRIRDYHSITNQIVFHQFSKKSVEPLFRLELDLPLFNNVSISRIMELKKNEYDSFIIFRNSIFQAFREVSNLENDFQKQANIINNDIIQPSVSLRINQSYIFKSCIFSILGCYFVPPNFDNTIYHNIVDI